MENPEKLPCKIDGSDDECWERELKENPPCADDDEGCWRKFKEVFGDDDKGEKPCGEQDFECWRDWGMENPEKLPCKIDGSDDECWERELKENPPCADDDEGCWEHFMEVFGDDDKGEKPPCGEQDFKCWRKWGEENPEKLPCKIDGSDDECWERVLKEDPPCKDDDEDCWRKFKDAFGDMDKGEKPCGEQDFECWKKWGMENPEKLPCKIDGSDDECWERELKENPPCKDDDEGCWKHFMEVFGDEDKGDKPPCGEQDFKCWRKWGEENPEKLPCKIDGSDDECWERVLKEDPPCKDDDEGCWKKFKEAFGDKVKGEKIFSKEEEVMDREKPCAD
jgi:hypothetical protein